MPSVALSRLSPSVVGGRCGEDGGIQGEGRDVHPHRQVRSFAIYILFILYTCGSGTQKSEHGCFTELSCKHLE